MATICQCLEYDSRCDMTYKEEIEWKAWNDLIWQSPSSDKWSKRLADVTDGRLDFDRVHNAVKKMKYHIENDIVSDKAQKIFRKLYHLWENKEYVYGIFSPSFYKGRFTFGEKLSADEIAAVRTVFDTNKLYYECLYNEESNAVYVKFYSFEHGNDEAIILLDDDSIFYSSIYSTIKEDNYDKFIEYGDYALMMYEIASDNDNWVEVELSE